MSDGNAIREAIDIARGAWIGDEPERERPAEYLVSK